MCSPDFPGARSDGSVGRGTPREGVSGAGAAQSVRTHDGEQHVVQQQRQEHDEQDELPRVTALQQPAEQRQLAQGHGSVAGLRARRAVRGRGRPGGPRTRSNPTSSGQEERPPSRAPHRVPDVPLSAHLRRRRPPGTCPPAQDTRGRRRGPNLGLAGCLPAVRRPRGPPSPIERSGGAAGPRAPCVRRPGSPRRPTRGAGVRPRSPPDPAVPAPPRLPRYLGVACGCPPCTVGSVRPRGSGLRLRPSAPPPPPPPLTLPGPALTSRPLGAGGRHLPEPASAPPPRPARASGDLRPGHPRWPG